MMKYHDNVNFNYQINRAIYLSGARKEDLQKIVPHIHDCQDWKKSFIKLGDEAVVEKRIANAATYYRMSEFFMFEGDPDKKKYYDLSVNLFYQTKKAYLENKEVVKTTVPFEGYELPVLYRKASNKFKEVKGTILLHGGNDSYLEEFWNLLFIFSEAGYDTYIFEGPGQGCVLRKQEAKFISQWERPVKAVLDHFSLENVTIIGASLGGMFAQRAAAFEKRIIRVIAWPAFINLQEVMMSCRPESVQKAMRFFLKYNLSGICNKIIYKKIEKGDFFLEWAMMHGMYAYGVKTPFEYMEKAAEFHIEDVMDKITQDVLLLGGQEDHVVSYKFVGDEVKLLTQAHSVTARVFNEKEHAGAHCNVDNTSLVCNIILRWMEQLDEASGKEKSHDSVILQFNW